MKDLKEKVLIIALILLFSFWYLYTGYLVFDYFTNRMAILSDWYPHFADYYSSMSAYSKTYEKW